MDGWGGGERSCQAGGRSLVRRLLQTQMGLVRETKEGHPESRGLLIVPTAVGSQSGVQRGHWSGLQGDSW